MSLLLAYGLPDPEHSAPARLLLVLGYVLAGVCWWRASRRAGLTQNDAFSNWWLAGAVGIFLLALNKLIKEWKPVLPWLGVIRYYDWRFALEVAGILLVVLAALIAHPLPAQRR